MKIFWWTFQITVMLVDVILLIAFAQCYREGRFLLATAGVIVWFKVGGFMAWRPSVIREFMWRLS